ncbi:hypothetical protein AYI68_g3276 [Smittium mucronatum]|uniref:RNase H type-1 domain-containing protein n=1 Tax=Smittium mucronatum TaxID=133383 RepID=A0A1R0H0D7_9FUNG|nr:hypothetical protein AYI68_g3276 [Smittium mucronatum]
MMGRFCTEFVVEKSYRAEFERLISKISVKYDISELYSLKVDFDFDRMAPNCYDFEQVRSALPTKAKKILYKHSFSMLLYRTAIAFESSKNLVLKQFFLSDFTCLLSHDKHSLFSSTFPSMADDFKGDSPLDPVLVRFFIKKLTESSIYSAFFSSESEKSTDKRFCSLDNPKNIQEQANPPFLSSKNSPSKLFNEAENHCGLKYSVRSALIRNNWSSISLEQIKHLIPESSEQRLVAYTDGSFISKLEGQSAGIGIYFDPPSIPCIYQKILSPKKSPAYSELFSIITALQTISNLYSPKPLYKNSFNSTSPSKPKITNLSSISEVWIVSDKANLKIIEIYIKAAAADLEIHLSEEEKNFPVLNLPYFSKQLGLQNI